MRKSQQSQPAPARELAVVFLVTENVDALVRFYRDVLGLQMSGYQPGHSAWFDTGTVRLAIHRPESEGRERRDLVPKTDTVIWFRPQEGVRAATESLRRAGLELIVPENAENYVFVRDPEGRVLGFHEPPGLNAGARRS